MKKIINYLPFFVLFFLPVLFYPAVDTSGWRSSGDVHALLEFASSLLATTAGIMVLLHFFTTGRWFFLIISIGFVLIGTEEFVHAIFSFSRIWYETLPSFELAISTTWLTGNFILATSFFLALIFGKKEIIPATRVLNAVACTTIGLIFAAAVTLLIFQIPFFPYFVQLGSFTKKIIELSLALLYFVAFLFYADIYLKQQSHSPLLWSIVAFIVFRVLAHIFVFDAQDFYDAHWDAAHLIVFLSYFFPIFGVWGETIKLQKSFQAQIIELEKEMNDRKRAEKALHESEEGFRAVAENAHEGMIIALSTGTHIYANEHSSEITGYSVEELLKIGMNDLAHPHELPKLSEILKKRIAGEKAPERYETTIVHKSGKIVPIELTGARTLWHGQLATLVVFRDITERKLAEAALRASLNEKEILLGEIHHRTKNNMQVMSGLLDLQASSTGNPELIAMLNQGQRRIRSMGLVHEKLLNSKDFARIDLADYARSLSQELFQAYNINQRRINLDIQSAGVVNVDINKATPCGLILNELISNALKHAFPGDGRGEIRIVISKTKDAEIEIVVHDNGLGLPADIDIHQPHSMGLHLVNGLVVKQLDGQIEVRRDAGTEFRIKFPLLFVENREAI